MYSVILRAVAIFMALMLVEPASYAIQGSNPCIVFDYRTDIPSQSKTICASSTRLVSDSKLHITDTTAASITGAGALTVAGGVDVLGTVQAQSLSATAIRSVTLDGYSSQVTMCIRFTSAATYSTPDFSQDVFWSRASGAEDTLTIQRAGLYAIQLIVAGLPQSPTAPAVGVARNRPVTTSLSQIAAPSLLLLASAKTAGSLPLQLISKSSLVSLDANDVLRVHTDVATLALNTTLRGVSELSTVDAAPMWQLKITRVL